MILSRVLFVTILINYTIQQELFKMIQIRKDNSAKEKQAHFTKTFLKVYTEFSLMFHVENTTTFSIMYLLKLVHDDIFGEIVIINQDTLKYVNFQQRKGFPFLHVVILHDPNKFSSFLKMPGCLINTDVVIFVLLSNEEAFKEEFWKMPKLHWAGNVVILSFVNTTVSVYNVCYYCGDYTKRLHHLQTSSTNSVKIDTSQLLARNFSNFSNHRFNIGYVDSFPFMLCEVSKELKQNEEIINRCAHASGLEMGILQILKEKLNFTYVLTEYRDSLSRYDQDINKVGAKKLDFIIGGLSITAATAPKMSFTSALAFEPITFLYIPRESVYSELFDILKPFKSFVWIIVIITTFWFSLSLYVCIRIITNDEHNIGLPLSTCFKVSYRRLF